MLRVGGPFNFARLINAGASLASGDFLLLLNNDVEALDEGWLDEMRSRAAEPDVGAVGAALLWPSGVISTAELCLESALRRRMPSTTGRSAILATATFLLSRMSAARRRARV